MFRIASYVKIDLMATDRSALPELVGKLKKYNLKRGLASGAKRQASGPRAK